MHRSAASKGIPTKRKKHHRFWFRAATLTITTTVAATATTTTTGRTKPLLLPPRSSLRHRCLPPPIATPAATTTTLTQRRRFHGTLRCAGLPTTTTREWRDFFTGTRFKTPCTGSIPSDTGARNPWRSRPMPRIRTGEGFPSRWWFPTKRIRTSMFFGWITKGNTSARDRSGDGPACGIKRPTSITPGSLKTPPRASPISITSRTGPFHRYPKHPRSVPMGPPACTSSPSSRTRTPGAVPTTSGSTTRSCPFRERPSLTTNPSGPFSGPSTKCHVTTMHPTTRCCSAAARPSCKNISSTF
mmetsp:Transcript_10342/g.21724  ORF Transcript_10342/g.21724 Transcript_10342/m.21724 type:complete len:300 (+) Transcript_10342:350-1249(+)